MAKVIVRVNLLKDLPTRVVSGYSDGREFEVDVSYPWLPPRCTSCNVYGHSTSECRRNVAPASGMTSRRRSSGRRSRSSRRSKQSPRNDSSRQGRSRPPLSISPHENAPSSSKGYVCEESVNVAESKQEAPENEVCDIALECGVAQECAGVQQSDKVGTCANEDGSSPQDSGGNNKDVVSIITPVSIESSQFTTSRACDGQNSPGSTISVSESEQPFFLVSHRKGGRKAKNY